MTEKTYKYDQVFPATNAQASLISRRIHGIAGNSHAGYILLGKQHAPFQSKKGGLPKRVEGNFYAFMPHQIRTVCWQQPSGKEELTLKNTKDGLQVHYRGEGSFEGVYYRTLLEAMPEINPCATICHHLMQVAASISEKTKQRQKMVIEAAQALVNAPSSANGLTLIPPLMAAKLSALSADVLETGIRALRHHLAPQIAA